MSRAPRAAISVVCCVAVLGALLITGRWLRPEPPSAEGSSDGRYQVSETLARQVQELAKREEGLRESLWKNEALAQAYGAVIESLWDQLRSEHGGLSLLEDLKFESVVWGKRERVPDYRSDIQVWRPVAEQVPPAEPFSWQEQLRAAIAEGWELESSEFRHVRFDLTPNGLAKRSEFYFRASLTKKSQERVILEGPLFIDWKNTVDPIGRSAIERVDLSGLEIRARSGGCPFEVIIEEAISPPRNAHAIDPLLVRDLDGDGKAEIILANRNLAFRMDDQGQYFATPLCTFPPGLISSAIFGDFDGDGSTDLLCTKHEGMVVLRGSERGVFDQREVLVWPNDGRLPYPMVLSSGDMDGDGDLDLFVGQYRVPYDGGSLPTPYFDANDGPPAYLLRNDGDLNFSDISDQTSFTIRRNRRIYSGSFVDLDGLLGTDLIVVSDFAGTDYYRSSDRGQILNSVSDVLGDTLGFGMAHTISDFNRDGDLDLLMIGMTSPTVDRLEHLGLRRSGLDDEPSVRARMVHGNRLFLSSGVGGFTQNTELSQSIAQSGWAWGCGAGDFDNDGFSDVFIGNGLESRESVRDYESEYWLHDAFIANSAKDSVAYLYFKEKFERTRGVGHSYGGYESNRLYLNHRGETFVEVGSLWGVGIQRDTRNVVVQDLDADGGVDIALIHFEVWPEPKQTLKVYRNRFANRGNWIGFKFAAAKGQPPPTGAKVTLEANSFRVVDEIVSGDSYRSQHDTVLHFGIGTLESIPEVTVRWAEGTESVFANLEANRYYWVRPGDLRSFIDKE